MHLIDHLSAPHGRLSYDVYQDGVLVESVSEKNRIVDGYKQTHARLLGGDVANRSISKFGVGTNGALPQAADTTLAGSFIKSIDSVEYPAANQVQFNFSLASGEANGTAIMELGLMTGAGVLYARRVRELPLNKHSGISISGSWVITF